ncbi:MAG: phosphodiester glycosidase family protein [Muribaculaceae bacterium]|nr:phosphodiester glycosidase family protein [Muribaculaceae bacterium]
MKKPFVLALLAVLLLGTSAGMARDQWVIGDNAYEVDTLIFPHLAGPGVYAAKYDIPALPLKVSVVEMDLTNPYMVMETCLGGEKSVACETPVSMATRNSRPGHEVVGAVNADFFMTSPTNEVGLPLSGQVRNDELVLSGHNRACLALDTENRPYIDRMTFTGRVTCGETSFALNLVNRMRYAYEGIATNQSFLFTRSYGPVTYDASNSGKMVLIKPAGDPFKWNANGVEHCIVESIFDAQGSTTIPDGKAILWLKGSYANYAASLNPGDAMDISFTFTLNNGPHDVTLHQLVGGSNHIIMKNGQFMEDWAERHPRTAVGFNADSTRLFFVVVDGRHMTSVGVTLKEMKGIFDALGVVTAVNLDGGGSSCILVNDEVMNHPSDGPVRAVGNGCLFVSTAPEDDDIGIINFEPRCYNLSISATTSFAVWGYNQYGVLKTRDLQGCTFSCDPQVGTFDDEGYFHAVSTPADGNLYVNYNGVTATQHVTIMEAQWQLVSDSVVLDQFHTYPININGVSGYGLDKVDPSVVEWYTADDQVCTVDDMGVVTAVADGRTYVGSTHPLLADSLLVSVENPKGRVTTVENAPIDPATWDVTQSGGKDRTVSALNNGMQIDFTGASSRNPYIKITKAVRLWGIPDTLRLRLIPGDIQLKTVKMLLENAYGDRVTVEYDVPDASGGEVTIDAPVSDICDVSDLGYFPLQLIYYYITYNAVTTGEPYSLKIPGMELVYAAMPPDEHQPVAGDVNLDGEINIADINAVINVILSSLANPAADVNNDGEVNIADINYIINLILS